MEQCAFDHNLRCPLTELLDFEEYMEQQIRPWPDCVVSMADQSLRFSHCLKHIHHEIIPEDSYIIWPP